MNNYKVSEDFLNKLEKVLKFFQQYLNDNFAEYCGKSDTCCEECACYNAECICIWFYVNDLICDIENGFEED